MTHLGRIVLAVSVAALVSPPAAIAAMSGITATAVD
jgi:hypothetical protein